MAAVTNAGNQQNIFYTFIEESSRLILENKVKAAAIAVITTLGALFISPALAAGVFFIHLSIAISLTHNSSLAQDFSVRENNGQECNSLEELEARTLECINSGRAASFSYGGQVISWPR